MLTIFGWNFEIEERCKGVHCVDLGESFPTSIYLVKSASIQPRTSPSKFGGKIQSNIHSPPYSEPLLRRAIAMGLWNEEVFEMFFKCMMHAERFQSVWSPSKPFQRRCFWRPFGGPSRLRQLRFCRQWIFNFHVRGSRTGCSGSVCSTDCLALINTLLTRTRCRAC